ncbi:MAG: UDP-N-acetylmuramate--L-alanine ligase [Cyanobacteria bacterium J06635_15]
MLNSVDFSGRPFHFIGIGGIGMSALAYVLAKRKLSVSGSDLRLTHITQRLQAEGVHVFWQQDGSNLNFSASKQSDPTSAQTSNGASNAANGAVRELPQVICSTAINLSNAEYRAAKTLGCPIFHRSDLLAALMADYKGIAVAGTHGKTTTSSLIGYLLMRANLDPTIVIGGEVAAWQGNARLGQGDYLVAEADESDGSLAKLSAQFGIITNIELDHPDHYSTLDEVVDIFKAFQRQCKITIGSIDCATVRQVIKPDISYSLNLESAADYIATDLKPDPIGTMATVWERGERLGELRLPMLGQHNVSNALAAIAVGRQLDLPFAQIADILKDFQGARRRFEHRGFHQGILFVDDYGHHPSEVRATLSAARLKARQSADNFSERRVVAIFQPHRYSRAAALLSDFAGAFGDADQVIVTDIYAAGEQNTHNITGSAVAQAIAGEHPQTQFCASLDDVKTALRHILRPGDIAIFLSAGNLNQVIPDVMAFYQQVDAAELETVHS